MKIENAPNDLSTLEECLLMVDDSFQYDSVSHGGNGNFGETLEESDLINLAEKDFEKIKQQVSFLVNKTAKVWSL